MYVSLLLSIIALIIPIIDLSTELSAGALVGNSNFFKANTNKINIYDSLAHDLLFNPSSNEIESKLLRGFNGVVLNKSINNAAPVLFSEFKFKECINFTNLSFTFTQGSLRSAKTCNVADVFEDSTFKQNLNSALLNISLDTKNLITFGAVIINHLQIRSKSLAVIAGGDIYIESLSTPLNSKLWLISGTGKIKVRSISGSALINAKSKYPAELPDNAVLLSDLAPLRSGRFLLSLSPVTSPEDS